MNDEKSDALVPALDLGVAKPDLQDELAAIASEAAKPYFVFADLIARNITNDEVLAAARTNSKEAPMFMHMIKDFMGAQIKTNARDKAEKKSVNIFVGAVNLPPRRDIRDVEIIEIDEADQGRRDNE